MLLEYYSSLNNISLMNDSTSFQHKLWHQLDDFNQLQSSWQQLLTHCPTHTIFQTWTWQHCWLSVFKPQTKLWLVTLWQQQTLIAIAPLYLDDDKVLHIIGTASDKSQACDNGSFICHPDYPESTALLLDIVLEKKRAWKELRLHNFHQHNSRYSETLDYLHEKRYPFINSFLYDAPSRILGNTQADNALINHKKFRYFDNWFKRQGDFNYHHLTEPQAIQAQLPDFFQQHKARWQITPTPSKFNHALYIQFFKRLIEDFADIKAVHLSFLTLDGEAVAYDFSFYYRQRYLYYTPSDNPNYAKKSASYLLHKHLLQHLTSINCRECDYSIGSESYKYKLSNKVYKVNQLRIFSTYYHYSLNYTRLKLRAWLNARPRLYHLLCKMRGLE